MRLNLGSGDRYAQGWTNVDFPGCPHPRDETVDLTGDLPWEDGSVTHVYAGHLLEHLTPDACLALLERLLPKMAPGGQIMVVGPDVPVAREMERAGTLDVTLDSLRFGGGRWKGDVHRWECSGALVFDMLASTGWQKVTNVGIGSVPEVWPVADRNPQWQCAISAQTPVDIQMITVITPTIPGREGLLEECRASVAEVGLLHLIEVDQAGEGPAAVRNRLAELVTTPWLLPLDDDDLLLPHYLDVVGPYLNDADVVYTNWYLSGAEEPQPIAGFDPDMLRQQNFIPVTAAIRTDMFREAGGFPVGADLEDHALWLRLLDMGARFLHIPVTCWRYRRQPGSRTEHAN